MADNAPLPIDELDSLQECPADFNVTCKLLYASHFLSAWNSRVFEFAAFLFLADIHPGTLLPASVYALTRAASATLLSPWIGSYIDGTDRLRVVRLSIVGQRSATALSCAIFLTLALSGSSTLPDLRSSLSLGLLSVLACVEKLSAVMNMVAVERDWVVVIASNDEERLRAMNSQMRRIDLFCKLGGPLAIALVDTHSTVTAICVVGIMTALSVAVEYLAIAKVYRRATTLATPKMPLGDMGSPNPATTVRARVTAFSSTIHKYTRHPAFLPSFALSLLYLTVLSFAGQMITYLIALGISASALGALRGISAGFEMSATWLAPKTIAHIGPVRAGIWFLNWQLCCVAIACVFIWTDLDPTLAAMGVVAAVIASRVGLWGFDLSVQIIVQEEVDEESRGVFSACEQSFQNLFEMVAFASTIVFPDPASLRYPATLSAAAVAAAGITYATFVRIRRGHLVHLSSCLDPHGQLKDHRHWWMLRPRETEMGRYSHLSQTPSAERERAVARVSAPVELNSA